MFEQLPMYQNMGGSAYKKDLKNITLLCDYLNNPQKNFRSVHVGGTNGKGSTSHMISSVLQEAGYKVGLYTSPHIKDFRERIKINGESISKDYVTNFINKNFDNNKKLLLIEALWEIVLSDGKIHDYESNLIRRLAGLLYISDINSGNARKRALNKI